MGVGGQSHDLAALAPLDAVWAIQKSMLILNLILKGQNKVKILNTSKLNLKVLSFDFPTYAAKRRIRHDSILQAIY
jgi:hypothetical protein